MTETRVSAAPGALAPASPTATDPAPVLTGRNGKTHSPRYMWGILAIGIGAQAAFSAAFQGIPTTGAQLQSAYRYTDSQLGLVLAAVTFGIFVTDVFWGIAADRYGERRVLLIGLTGTTVCLGVAAAFLTPQGGHRVSPWALSAVVLLAGALGGCVNGASGRAIMGWFPVSKRGFAISLRVAAVPAGGAIGAGVLPWLADSGGFRWVFGFLAAAGGAATIAAALWLDEPPLARSHDASGPTTVSPLRRFDIWRMASTAFLLDLPQFTVLTFGSVFLHDVKHIPLSRIAALLVVTQIMGGLSRVVGGRWTDRRGGRNRRTIVTVYSGIITLGFLGIAAFESAPSWIVAALMVVSGTLSFGWHGVHYAEIATMAGAERSGAALGLENTMVFGGAFITPLIIPWLLNLSSWSTVMVVTGAVPAFLSMVIMPREPRREPVR
jgi:MFS family permease